MKQQSEQFYSIIGKIKSSNVLVIVEGKKDRAAMNRLGIVNIIALLDFCNVHQ